MGKHLLIIGLLFFQFAVAQSKGVQKEAKRVVKLLEANKQDWISGAPGGGAGTNYSIKLQILTDKKIEFKNLWLGAENVSFQVASYSADVNKKVQAGDSVEISYNQVSNPNKKQDAKNDSNSKRPPLDYKGVALVEYIIGGSARYYVIKSFKQVVAVNGQ